MCRSGGAPKRRYTRGKRVKSPAHRQDEVSTEIRAMTYLAHPRDKSEAGAALCPKLPTQEP